MSIHGPSREIGLVRRPPNVQIDLEKEWDLGTTKYVRYFVEMNQVRVTFCDLDDYILNSHLSCLDDGCVMGISVEISTVDNSIMLITFCSSLGCLVVSLPEGHGNATLEQFLEKNIFVGKLPVDFEIVLERTFGRTIDCTVFNIETCLTTKSDKVRKFDRMVADAGLTPVVYFKRLTDIRYQTFLCNNGGELYKDKRVRTFVAPFPVVEILYTSYDAVAAYCIFLALYSNNEYFIDPRKVISFLQHNGLGQLCKSKSSMVEEINKRNPMFLAILEKLPKQEEFFDLRSPIIDQVSCEFPYVTLK